MNLDRLKAFVYFACFSTNLTRFVADNSAVKLKLYCFKSLEWHT